MIANKSVINPIYIKTATVLLSIFIIGYLAIAGKELLAPLIIASLLTMLILPVSCYFEMKLKFPRSLSTVVSLFILFGGIILILYLLGPQLSKLGSDWPVFKEQIFHILDGTKQWISNKFHIGADKEMGYVKDATSKIISSSTVVLGTTVITASSLLLFLVFIIIYTFFLLTYRRHILRFFVKVFHEKNKGLVYEIFEKVQYIIRKYISGLLLEMGIVTLVCCLAFAALGIRYAILLGLVIGIFNIIPYIGIFSALLISCLITFATGASVEIISAVAAIIIGVHIIDSNVLLPVIVGSKVRINPFVTIIGVIIGEMMWGISGMFLSIPVIAILKIIFDRIEGLKPWGFLLGDDRNEKRIVRLKRKGARV